MDLFDDDELLAQMHQGNFMAEDDMDDPDNEEDLAHLREMESHERKFKRALRYPDPGNEDQPHEPEHSSEVSELQRLDSQVLLRHIRSKRARGEGDTSYDNDDQGNNTSLPLVDLPEDFENLDELPAAKIKSSGPLPRDPTQSPLPKRQKVLSDITNSIAAAMAPNTEEKLTSRLIHKRVPDGDFQSVTLATGERYYLSVTQSTTSLVKNQVQFGELCGVPYADLKEQAFMEQAKLTPELQDQLRLSHTDTNDSGCESMDEEGSRKCLWVEKFKPKSYLELLSDDGTNRILLKWLKLWDQVVFGKVKPVKVRKPKENDQNDKFGKWKKFSNVPEVQEELDEHHRPGQKVALLHGPPGLGKTTLAHVIARHAGYNVVEMNASDDRALQTFRAKLEAATQMKSVSAKDRRPNCLIIDEIDGSPVQTINHLVTLICGKQTKKGSKQGEVLKRPIICICNDLYVPALRPLKQHCLIVPFPPTLSGRLSQRLLEISRKENLLTDTTALNALCEKTENDIRSCLSTLQFFKSKGKPLRTMDVQQANVGQKDSQKSHFSVWNELFQLPRGHKRTTKRVRSELVQIEESRASLPLRFSNMFHLASSCGDYDKLMQGVFENYLQVKFKDSQLENVIAGHEWFCFFDLTQEMIGHSQVYALMGYQPFAFVASHLLFGSLHKTRIMYPYTPSEKNNALNKTKNLISSMISDMAPMARAFASTSAIVFDTLPMLLEIMQPVLRPVNTQLYSPREKQELKNLVQTMIAYNLQYVQQLGADGQYEYRLDPSVDEVSHFPGIPHRSSLTYSLKQVIAHEIQLEKMRADEIRGASSSAQSTVSVSSTASSASMQGHNMGESRSKNESRVSEDQTGGPRTSTKLEASSSSSSSSSSSTTPNHLQKLKAKEIDVVEHNPVDFFGRKIEGQKADRDRHDCYNNEIRGYGNRNYISAGLVLKRRYFKKIAGPV
ncbi:chromosome transmission fidelity protein 18 homolog isoform X2 [Tigriopus californicus]|uniref:chromosome transmission fidelity protein 18 homolog isoform X2 n=1 Tax=Tigriopus californicus TaxID=6832 RepID=UPI0027D9E941|nr:chromosome transmission fidelity protein 18 homolog isoform X2 [Tigriopus californicus]